MPIAHAQLHELLISTINQLVTEIGSKSVLQKEWVTGSISHYVFFVVCVQVFFILCSLTIWASNFSVYPKEWTRSLVSTQPIRIIFICCIYFLWKWNNNSVRQTSNLHSHWLVQKFLSVKFLVWIMWPRLRKVDDWYRFTT